MADAPVIKTIFTVDLTPYVDGLQTMMTMTETTGKQLQGLLSVQPKQPDFSGLQTQLTAITQRTQDYLKEQAELPPVLAADSEQTTKFGDSNEGAGKKVEGHMLKMRGLKRESRESFQAIAFLAISISSMAESAGGGDTKLSKMARTMGEGVSATFGLASMLVALEIASGGTAVVIGAVVAVAFALVKIFDDSEAKVNALKSAMEGFNSSLRGASLSSLEDYRKNLQALKETSDGHLKTLKEQLRIQEAAVGMQEKKISAIKEEIKQEEARNAVFTDSVAKVDAEISAKQVNFVEAQKFAQEALTAATINQFAQRRKAADQTWQEEQDKYKGHNDALYAAKVKHWAEMKRIDEEERNFNQQLADQDFEQQLAKIKEQGAKEHTQADEIDIVILMAQREHYKEQYDAILAITGELSNEQLLKKKELETKLTQLELDETEKRIALKKREEADIEDLANKDFEVTLARIRTRGIEAGKTDWQIALEEIAREKMKNDAELNLLDAQYEKEEITDAEYAKKKAALDLKTAQLEEAQAKEENKRDDADAKAKKERLDAEVQNRQAAFEDFSSNLQEAGKMSQAAFEASKAYEMAQTTISTYSSAQKAYEAFIGIPVFGPELAIAAAAAAVLAGLSRVDQIAKQSYTGYGLGGEVTEPTLALLGEMGEDEIVAPRRNFIQVWREDLLPLALKDISGASQQGSSGATSADIASVRKEIAALRKSFEQNKPVTIISSDTDWQRFQKGADKLARRRKMLLL